MNPISTPHRTAGNLADLMAEFEAEEGYPVDEWIEKLQAFPFDPHSAARFLVDHFIEISRQISCCVVEVTDSTDEVIYHPAKMIYFATGGWSGAEDLIGTMLTHFWIRHFYSMWKRGGAYWFEVPMGIYSHNPESKS